MSKTETRRLQTRMFKLLSSRHTKTPEYKTTKAMFLIGAIAECRFMEKHLGQGNETAKMFGELMALREHYLTKELRRV